MPSKGLIYTNPNLLINADGTDPLDQRNSLPAINVSDQVYYVDRWYSQRSTTQTDWELQSGGGLRATAITVGAGTYSTFTQKVESYEQLAGKTVTLSASVKSETAGVASISIYDGVSETWGTLV